VQVAQHRVTISDAGREVAAYVFADPKILRPGWQNVYAPGGVRITRNHPPVAPEATDHDTMHPGIWLGFGDINGTDFWRNKGRIEHERFTEAPRVVDGAIRFSSVNRFVTPAGDTIGRLELRQQFSRRSDAYFLTVEATFVSDTQDLVFGDQEEMGLGVRLTTPLTEKSGGQVLNSDGVAGAKPAWGKVADWCSYSKTVEGRVHGAAIFSASSNPRRPWWHTRDYGVMVANAFGAKSQPTIPDGKLTVPRGKPLVLRYGVMLFNAPAGSPPDLAAAYREFNAQSGAKP
jgi:hypothetical protein